MSAFTGPLVIEEIEPGRRWRLREPILFEAEFKGSGKVITVPAGFETDGASIPSPINTVLAVWGTYGRAAALHDYLYRLIREGRDFPSFLHVFDPLTMSMDRRGARRKADLVFYDAMIACGTARWLASIMWLAVRLFGGRWD